MSLTPPKARLTSEQTVNDTEWSSVHICSCRAETCMLSVVVVVFRERLGSTCGLIH